MFSTSSPAQSARLLPLLLAFAASTAFGQQSWNELTYPALREISVPAVQRVKLDNGLLLYLVEDHELPLINLSARVGTGSVFEPADKVGLASITGTVMRTGGTTSRSGDEIDLLLENIGASVETGIGDTNGGASMSVLKGDIDLGLDILADVLMNPAFPEDKIELAKVTQRSVISRRNDDAQEIGFREFDGLIFGKDSPYARYAEYATIDAISRDDLVAFHQAYFHPNNTQIGIWGDFDSKAMVERVKKAFRNWKPAKGFVRPAVPAVDYVFRPSVNLVEKEDVNQSTIIMGHIGGRLDNPDYFALEIMNRILGGGFSSRLFLRVRSDQGLAYSVFGTYGANYDRPGTFYAGIFSKSESTVQAIRAVKKEIENMRTEPVTDKELSLAKDAFLNSFVFNFDSKAEVMSRLMTYEYYGYPADFLQRIKDGVESVTREDVMRVAKTYLQPENLHLLVVGKASDFDEPLSVLGPVQTIDIAIPEPGAAVPEATEETRSAGRDRLDAAIEASGGKEAFAGLRSMRLVGSQTVAQMGGMALDLVLTYVFPDRLAVQVTTPMGAITQVLDGDTATMTMGPQSGPAPAEVKAQLQGNLFRLPLPLFAQSDRVDVQDLGMAQVLDATYAALRITPPVGSAFTLYLDPETSLPAAIGTTEGGVETLAVYSDFREVEGLRTAFKTSVLSGGEEVTTLTVKEIVPNAEPEEGLFGEK